jgi:4'-phosphopantetheinyl transferase EntD
VTSRDAHPEPTPERHLAPHPWQLRIAIDALPFVRLSAHAALPHGQVALVDTELLDRSLEDASTALHPQELELVETLPQTRRTLFISGRLALRAAIDRVDRHATSAALLRNTRGAPTIPQGLVGSISHKRTMAVAIVAPVPPGHGSRTTVGIDIEQRAHMRPALRDISPRILTGPEIHMLPHDVSNRNEAVLLFFALKEAIYKAIDPYVQRHVRFQEVEVTAHDSLTNDTGSGSVALNLPEFAAHAPTVSVHWWKDDNHLFAVATGAGTDP